MAAGFVEARPGVLRFRCAKKTRQGASQVPALPKFLFLSFSPRSTEGKSIFAGRAGSPRGTTKVMAARQATQKTEKQPIEIKLAHSPDSDDAFMFYALATHKLATPGYKYTHILSDIQ